MGLITGLNHITFAVVDLDRSFHFYNKILEFTPLCKWPEGAYFAAGEMWFCLSLDPKRKEAKNPCYTHIAFNVEQEDFHKITERLREYHIMEWKENISEGDSIYFLDPDGHKLEIHVGTWQDRLKEKKKNPWEGSKFYA